MRLSLPAFFMLEELENAASRKVATCGRASEERSKPSESDFANGEWLPITLRSKPLTDVRT